MYFLSFLKFRSKLKTPVHLESDEDTRPVQIVMPPCAHMAESGQTGTLLHSSSGKALSSLARDPCSDRSASQRLHLLKHATISTQEFREHHSVHTDVISICFVSFLLWFVFPVLRMEPRALYVPSNPLALNNSPSLWLFSLQFSGELKRPFGVAFCNLPLLSR